MALLETWRGQAYNAQTDQKQMQAFWDEYFKKEKAIYEQLLEVRNRYYDDDRISGRDQ